MTLLSMLASAETVLVDGIRYNLISRAIKESGIFNLCYALWSQMYTCERFLCFYLPPATSLLKYQCLRVF